MRKKVVAKIHVRVDGKTVFKKTVREGEEKEIAPAFVEALKSLTKEGESK